MQLLLVAGLANSALAEAVARGLRSNLADREVSRFPDGEIHVEIRDTVRDADVYLLAPTAPPIEANLLQLLLLADACRRGGALRITAVIPYFGYARQDRRASGREAVGARVVVGMLGSVGIERVVAVDLHTTAIEGLFASGLEHLSAVPALVSAIGAPQRPFEVVVAPDAGAIKLAERWARQYDLPVAIVHKTRLSGSAVRAQGLAGEVRNRRPLIVDDMISTGGTLASAITAVIDAGAKPDVTVAATHGLFVGPAVERLKPLAITRMYVTDTVDSACPPDLPIQLVSVAPLLVDAISRLHRGRSMSDLIVHA